MNTKFKSALVAIMILGTCSAAMAEFRFGVRTDNFYFSVGKYDYYSHGVPYGHRPRISFYDVMSDYGYWVYSQPFGRVWRPYVDYRWQPYLHGHWIYTQYGPTWQGYEPWAWAGYHYGDWVWTDYHGWVWVPGYDWHPGRVTWSYGPSEIGWMPAPPHGYDGYYRTPHSTVNVNFWVFIRNDHFRYDNYATCYLDRYRTRELFTRKAVRISSEPIQKTHLERIVKHRLDVTPVDVREVEVERKAVRMVIPRGEEERIRKNGQKVVQEVIRPAFEKERRSFKGESEHNKKAVERIFKQQPERIKAPSREVENRVESREKHSDRDRQFDDERKLNSKSPVKAVPVQPQRNQYEMHREPEKRTIEPNRSLKIVPDDRRRNEQFEKLNPKSQRYPNETNAREIEKRNFEQNESKRIVLENRSREEELESRQKESVRRLETSRIEESRTVERESNSDRDKVVRKDSDSKRKGSDKNEDSDRNSKQKKAQRAKEDKDNKH